MNTIHHVNPACLFSKPGLGPAAELLFGIAQKVTKKASPESRFSLRCSQRAGAAQIARGRAGMRAVGSWCDAWTARCSAPRRGLMGRFVTQQLFALSDSLAVISACFSRLLTLSIWSVKRPFGGRSTQKAMTIPNACRPGYFTTDLSCHSRAIRKVLQK